MQIQTWKTAIVAPGARSLDLIELKYSGGALSLLVEQEEDKKLWRLMFKTVQFFRTTAEECAAQIFAKLPEDGALFEVFESPLINELGETQFLAKSHHYIVCCYDEIIEIISWEAEITSAS